LHLDRLSASAPLQLLQLLQLKMDTHTQGKKRSTINIFIYKYIIVEFHVQPLGLKHGRPFLIVIIVIIVIKLHKTVEMCNNN